jgi:hypothetical protein
MSKKKRLEALQKLSHLQPAMSEEGRKQYEKDKFAAQSTLTSAKLDAIYNKLRKSGGALSNAL